MKDIKNNLSPIQGEGRVERIGHVQVVERQAFMRGFDQIEAGVVHIGGTKLIVAVKWNTMAPPGTAINLVATADFPELILPRFSPDCECPLSDAHHQELLGLH